MVDWQNPAVEARLQFVNTNMAFLLLGLYGWEYLLSLDVEYAVIRGRLAFRWALIPYIVGRFFLFVFLLLNAASKYGPTSNFTCLPGALSIAITGDIALGCTSTNLMIRTWVIWRESRSVRALLLLLALGQWIILALDAANIRGYQRPNGKCGVMFVHAIMNTVALMYSLAYDTIVFVLSLVGLSRQKSKSPLIKRLQAQGLLYFAVAVVTYIPPTVFSIFDVTAVVSATGLSAMTASTIASCRAVRSLLGRRTSQSSSTCDHSTEDTGSVALTSQIPVMSMANSAPPHVFGSQGGTHAWPQP